ncbi:MBL fold metallo-hydrolase [Thermaerobacter subterraneus]|uniref:Zn-dependent hydrolase, glyoxylase n=1 Tax=Thermaerobacter subterraneus DSM 13965 TaxID=867903 RepID=K6Q281_9FIRM|nr:MBL fold metallo-hydrolase [Thermaerobacter subterraneus]EKP95308.1 Zn-dependent hydrolase, glyoxylase [Thermaerobacter subterraneus DSM 13965]
MGATSQGNEPDRLPERPIDEHCWEMAPGLYRILLPLPWDVPFVNAYLVRAPGGWVLVDAGVGTPACLRALGWALRAAGVPDGGLAAILLTHRHPDHAGDVVAVRQRWGGRVYVHPAELELDRADPAVLEAWLAFTGMPAEVMETLLRRAERMPLPPDAVPYPRRAPLAEGPGLPAAALPVAGLTFEVVYVPGHSPGHVMLRVAETGWVFTGDHVLPRAGINVWANPAGPADPMGAYLANLEAVARLDAAWGLEARDEAAGAAGAKARACLARGEGGSGGWRQGADAAEGSPGRDPGSRTAGPVLPGHGLPWSGPMMPYATALAGWHRRAALALRDRLPDEPGPTAFEIVAARRPDDARHTPHRLRGAVAETLAFLLWLEREGLAGRRGDAPARWYRLPGPREG